MFCGLFTPCRVGVKVSTMPHKSLLLIAHAPSDNTRRLVEAVIQGGRHESVENVSVQWKPPLETVPEDLTQADAVILGTTENLGYMSGALKDFFDRCYYPAQEHTQAMPFGFFVRAGLDGTGTKRAILSIAQGMKWKLVQDPVICRGEWQDSFVERCEELGQVMALSLDNDLI